MKPASTAGFVAGNCWLRQHKTRQAVGERMEVQQRSDNLPPPSGKPGYYTGSSAQGSDELTDVRCPGKDLETI